MAALPLLEGRPYTIATAPCPRTHLVTLATPQIGGSRLSGTRSILVGTSYFGIADNADTTPGTRVTVSLTRGPDEAGAESSVALPPPVTVTAPSTGTRVSRGLPLAIGVNDDAGSIRVEWSSTCVSGGGLSFAEGQPVVLPAGTLRTVATTTPSDRTARCPVMLSVSRVLDGALDPALEGGSIRSERTVRVDIVSVP